MSAAIWLWLCLKLRTSGVCTFILIVIGAALMPTSGMMCIGAFGNIPRADGEDRAVGHYIHRIPIHQFGIGLKHAGDAAGNSNTRNVKDFPPIERFKQSLVVDFHVLHEPHHSPTLSRIATVASPDKAAAAATPTMVLPLAVVVSTLLVLSQ